MVGRICGVESVWCGECVVWRVCGGESVWCGECVVWRTHQTCVELPYIKNSEVRINFS